MPLPDKKLKDPVARLVRSVQESADKALADARPGDKAWHEGRLSMAEQIQKLLEEHGLADFHEVE